MEAKRLGLSFAALLVAIVAVVGVAAALASGDDDGGGRESVLAGDEEAAKCAADAADCVESGSDIDTGDGALGMCIEGVVDCVDTVVEPVDGDGSGDEPVSSDPITSGDDIDPDECSLVHNIDACARIVTELALGDLSGRLGVEVEAITVESAKLVEWPNACLGVEHEGSVCAEVISVGFIVTLLHDGTTYTYNTDTESTVLFID